MLDRLRPCGHGHRSKSTTLTGIDGARPVVACPNHFPVDRVVERPTLAGQNWTWADPTHSGAGAERTASLSWEPLLSEGRMALRFSHDSITLAVEGPDEARRLVQVLWAQGLPIHHPGGACIVAGTEPPPDGLSLRLEIAGRTWLAPLGVPSRARPAVPIGTGAGTRETGKQREWRKRLDRGGAAGLQQAIADRTAAATLLRTFETAVVPGLLQTPRYARSVLTEMMTTHRPSHRDLAADVESAVARRIERQQHLTDPVKRFEFI